MDAFTNAPASKATPEPAGLPAPKPIHAADGNGTTARAAEPFIGMYDGDSSADHAKQLLPIAHTTGAGGGLSGTMERDRQRVQRARRADRSSGGEAHVPSRDPHPGPVSGARNGAPGYDEEAGVCR